MNKTEAINFLLSLPEGELKDLMARIDCATKAQRKLATGPQQWKPLRHSIAIRTRARYGLPGGVKWLRGTLEGLGYTFTPEGKSWVVSKQALTNES